MLAAWVVHLRGHGAPVDDVQADTVVPLAAGSVTDAVAAVLGWLGVDDADVAALVERQVTELESQATS